MDIKKQIEYWRKGAAEDWAMATDLVQREKPRYGLFFAHLALEKTLKAHVCRATQDLAPRTHALLRLVELSQLRVSPEQRLFLSEFDRYQVEGRYPEDLISPPSPEEGRVQLEKAREILQWLMQQL